MLSHINYFYFLPDSAPEESKLSSAEQQVVASAFINVPTRVRFGVVAGGIDSICFNCNLLS
jgi:hypothetical protein